MPFKMLGTAFMVPDNDLAGGSGAVRDNSYQRLSSWRFFDMGHAAPAEMTEVQEELDAALARTF